MTAGTRVEAAATRCCSLPGFQVKSAGRRDEMSTFPNYWCQVWGTHDPTWPRALRAFEPNLYRAKREVTETGEARTVLIEGTVSNLPSQRHGSTGLGSRSAFDHGGHLIAARFGGPTS